MQVNKLILGTAQFGMNYGITNQHGQIEKPQISQILKYAYKNNILTLDTAEAYNNSEVAIGKNLKNKSTETIVKSENKTVKTNKNKDSGNFVNMADEDDL